MGHLDQPFLHARRIAHDIFGPEKVFYLSNGLCYVPPTDFSPEALVAGDSFIWTLSGDSCWSSEELLRRRLLGGWLKDFGFNVDISPRRFKEIKAASTNLYLILGQRTKVMLLWKRISVECKKHLLRFMLL